MPGLHRKCVNYRPWLEFFFTLTVVVEFKSWGKNNLSVNCHVIVCFKLCLDLDSGSSIHKWEVIKTKREDGVFLFNLLMPWNLLGKYKSLKRWLCRNLLTCAFLYPCHKLLHFLFCLCDGLTTCCISAFIWESSILKLLLLAWFEIQVCEF